MLSGLLSSARSLMVPFSFSTNTELSFTLVLPLSDAIMPTSEIMNRMPVMTDNRMMPHIVANIIFRNSFISAVVVLKYFKVQRYELFLILPNK